MLDNFDVTFVTFNGRHTDLSRRLAKQGYKVAVIDLTSQMGRWGLADYSSPYCLLLPDGTDSFLLGNLFGGADTHCVDRGFVLWTECGPVEFRGPMSSYGLRKLEVSDQTIDYFKFAHKNSDEAKIHKLREVSLSRRTG